MAHLKTSQVAANTTERWHVEGHGGNLLGSIDVYRSLVGGTIRTDETTAMAFVLPPSPRSPQSGRRARTKTFKGTGDEVFRRALDWIEKQVELMETEEMAER